MAQYDFFTQPRGPEIDPNLLVRSAYTGAQTQRITGTPFSNAVEGVTQGLKTGLELYSAYQDIGSQAKQDDIRDEQLKQEQMQTQRMSLEQEVIQNNEELIKQTKQNELEQAKVASQSKLQDSQNVGLITKVLTSGTTSEKAGLLVSPSVQETLFRTPDLAQKTIASLEASGVDPAIIKKARDTYDAVEIQKQRAALAASQTKAQAEFAQQSYEKYVPSLGYMQANSNAFNSVSKEPNFNPNNLKVFKNGTVDTDPDGTIVTNPDGSIKLKPLPDSLAQGYSLAYGNKVIDNAIATDEGIEFRKHLDNVKSYLASQFPKVAGTQSKDTGKPTTPKSDAPQQGTPVNQEAAQVKPGTYNENIVAAAKARNQQFQKSAQEQGSTSYNAMLQKGRQLTNTAATTVNPSYLSTAQNTPQIRNAPALTVETQPTLSTASPEGAIKHISNVLGGADVYADFFIDKKVLNPETIERVGGIPELQNKPAILKGLVAVESGGNSRARSGAGAIGLTQLMPAAASEVGVSPSERTDPQKSIEGGANYLENRYRAVEKSLKKALSDQGMPVQVDPRIALAAYNGGDKHVLAAINKGYTSWDDIKGYLGTVKSATNAKENISYPDKVIAASFPFVIGGNASDDSYLQTLLHFGILQTGV